MKIFAGARHDVHVYEPDQRPLLEVDLPDEEGGGHGYGQAWQRWQDDAGTWWYHVAWRRLDETSARLDHFRADQVRPDPTDWDAVVTQGLHRRT